MEQNFQQNKSGKEINLSMIFKLLLDKIKLLLFITLGGAIVGCGLGIGTTYNTHYYGTTLAYYVNPKSADSYSDSQSQYGVYGAYGKNVMDNMVKLLESEAFAEKLLLNEYGLPDEYANEGSYEAAVLAIEKVQKIELEVEDDEKVLERMEKELPVLRESESYYATIYQAALSEKQTAASLLLAAQTDGASGTAVAEYQAKLDKATADFETAEEKYTKARNDHYNAKMEILEAEKNLDEKKKPQKNLMRKRNRLRKTFCTFGETARITRKSLAR